MLCFLLEQDGKFLGAQDLLAKYVRQTATTHSRLLAILAASKLAYYQFRRIIIHARSN